MNPAPMPVPPAATRRTSALNRRNVLLAWGLVVFAMAVMVSIFWWRFSHHQAALPAGGAAGEGYQHAAPGHLSGPAPGPVLGQPQPAPVQNFAY